MVTRRFDVFDPVVITVGTVHAGTRRNVIADDARFEATVRTFSQANRDRIAAEAPELCRRIAEAHGVRADVVLHDEYPVTVNDSAETAFALDVARAVFGEDGVAPMPNPLTGSEDFSRVLAEVPGCYLFLGACVAPDHRTAPSNHSPRAAFADEVLPRGALLHTQLAVRSLARVAEARARATAQSLD